MTQYQKRHRIIATFFLLIFFPTLLPNNLFASNNGPVAPEANSFEPVDATDMVNLVTGDMAYVLPMLNIPSPEGGFPLALSNHSSIAMDQEASWVGLGWSLNPGAITRSVNGYPDDWTKTEVNSFFYSEGGVIDQYHFSTGGTFPNGLTLGLGASWGSNRAFAGNVTLGYGGARITAGNDGTFILGVGVDGAGVSVGSNGFTVGLGGNISNTMSGGLSYNFTNNQGSLGMNYGLGKAKMSTVGMSFSTNGSTSLSSNVGGGVNNETATTGKVDVDVNNQNMGIDLGAYWFGYGHTTITYFVQDINVKTISGSLYPYHYKKDGEIIVNYEPPYELNSTLKTNYSSDSRNAGGSSFNETPSEVLPMYNTPSYTLDIPDYDNYSVTAPGLSGSLAPYISEERLLSYNHSQYDNPNPDFSYDLNQKTHFYFKNSNSSFFRINDGAFRYDNNQSLENLNLITYNIIHGNFNGLNRDGNFYSNSITPLGDLIKIGNKMRTGNNIEVFTNADINSGTVLGFIEAKGLNRSTNEEELGIGAYRITTVDGKTYHYSLPVYQFETYSKNFKDPTNENKTFLEINKERKYATHWLLTAITGSDYYDVNQNGKVDEQDYGYWVEFEYGKWSDGYAWRSPHTGYKDIPDRKGNTNSYSYFWGRKQVYYLDAIKTRTNTALFIKKLRKDDNSTVFTEYKSKISSVNEFDRDTKCKQYGSQQFNTPIKPGTYYLSNGTSIPIPNDFTTMSGRQTRFMYVDAPKNYSLCLDKILLLKNEDAINVNKNRGNLLSISTGYIYYGLGYTNVRNAPFEKFPNFFTNKDFVKSFQSNLHQNVLDNVDVENLQLEKKSIKTINFDYNYELAKKSDNSEDSNLGRLTLKGVSFGGKQDVKVLPPYKFSYYGNDVAFNKNEKDVWGYNKSSPEAWSLKNIQTPVGANIELEYESDSYRRQAITETFNDFPTTLYKLCYNDNLFQDIRNVWKIGDNIIIDFLYSDDYGRMAASLYLGAEIYLQYEISNNGNFRDVYEIESFSKSEYSNLHDLHRITLKKNDDTEFHDHFTENLIPCGVGNTLKSIHVDIPVDVGTKPSSNSLQPINANGIKGGGLRVKSISIKDNSSNYKDVMEYSYLNPFSNKISGITSYTPFDYPKEVPSLSLLPSPGVMYEYVTVVKKNNIGTIVSKSQYEFNVLKPNNAVFHTPELNGREEYVRFGKYLKFKSKFKFPLNKLLVFDPNKMDSNPNNKKIWQENYQFEDRSSSLGSIKSIINLNKLNHITEQKKYYYKKELDQDGQKGVKENSYYSFNTNPYNQFITIKRSSIIEYPNILEKVVSSSNGYENTIFYDKYDFLTGKPTETRTVSSDGQSYKTKVIPAYSIKKYNPNLGYGMGSKIDHPTNKNMLTQTAAACSYILDKISNTWKETGVTISSWSNIWSYKDITGSTTTPIPSQEKFWRKHKVYLWKGAKDSNGIFINYNKSTDDGFNWSIGAEQPNQWKQVSETTLYDHFSAPLEMKDINGNFASTKMGDNDTKVMASGNAGYNEMFFSGAENLKDNLWLDQEVRMDGRVSQSTLFAHTGKYSVAATSSSVFVVNMKANEHRAGKYKLSVWVHLQNADKAVIKCGSSSATPVPFNGESQTAGKWVLKTHYYTIVDKTIDTYFIVTSADDSTVYFDDLMIRPVASSITGYVYNDWDELISIIGNNGLATKFEYDAAGRLSKTSTEIIDDNANGIIGGFKPSSENRIHYKSL